MELKLTKKIHISSGREAVNVLTDIKNIVQRSVLCYLTNDKQTKIVLTEGAFSQAEN